MTEEAVTEISPYLDACNVDLKAFTDAFYKKRCRARLQPVLDTIERLAKSDIWLEVTTLIIPGQNDDEGELRDLTRFLAGVDRDIPWHISRFHPDYRFDSAPVTPLETLNRAKEIGLKAGLQFVYLGNVPDADSDTLCRKCGRLLIVRRNRSVECRVAAGGHCPACGEKLPGMFE
jgi:pyruvate formate lyase activating enzyme